MSKFKELPIVGIDVSSDFSMVAILASNGDRYGKIFKITHDFKGYSYLLEELKKVEQEFNLKPVIFLESTGVYHLTLFHFLKNNELKVLCINPLITHSNKNKQVRKVKNDKRDALSIANIGKFENIKASDYLDVNIFCIRSLCRDYYTLIDDRSNYKKKLSADLKVYFPGYDEIFSDTTSKTSLEILNKYGTPSAILEASKDDLLNLIKSCSRKNISWCESKYNKLIEACINANKIGFDATIFKTTLSITLRIISTLNEQADALVTEIETLLNSDFISNSFRNNVALILSFSGAGFITAVTILSEIGDFSRFNKSKQLVAFFGVDSSVNESGKFKGDKNKMSKRGTKFGRRALYVIALASIRKTKNGDFVNPVLYEYRHNNLKGKKKKVALGAIMRKLLNYIFAVLRDQKPYQHREPKIHDQMFMRKSMKKSDTVAA